MQFIHNSPTISHARYERTLRRAKNNFFLVGMKTNIKNYMMQCDIYQREKVENTRPSGLL